jgi:hypothetical protein
MGDFVLKIESSTMIDQKRDNSDCTRGTSQHQGSASTLQQRQKRGREGGMVDLILKGDIGATLNQKSGNGEVTTSQHERGSFALTDEWERSEKRQRRDEKNIVSKGDISAILDQD